MIMHILLDLNLSSWPIDGDYDPLNNIRVFINGLTLSNPNSSIKIINSKKIIFDSCKDKNLVDCLTPFSSRVTPADLGISLMEKPDCVLIISMSKESPDDYLNYLKCMFVAQSHNIVIHGYSKHRESFIKMCCADTKGQYLESLSLRSLFGLLGLPVDSPSTYSTRCMCCHNDVSIGMVCPICLAIYCKFVPICKNCKIRFSFPAK